MEETEEGLESVGLGCSFDKFVEWKEIMEMIDNVSNLENQRQVEKAYERFKYIVNQYKEQPHLLDVHISEMLDKIVEIVRNEDTDIVLKHRTFQYMHLITNVRGYKVIVQRLPHAAADLEPVLVMLEAQNPIDTSVWETRYCLLLWLSIIVKIPFHMSRLDGSDGSDPTFKPIMARIIDVIKVYLMVGDASRTAAAFLSAHFLTRSDVKELYLKEFLEWACDWITKKDVQWELLGPLISVASILKRGKRDNLLPYAPWLLRQMLSMNWKEQPYRLNRKYAIKIIQRIGLTFLKVRIVSWRYQRGNRSLTTNFQHLNIGDPSSKPIDKNKEDFCEEEDDQDVPPEIEEVIEELMQGLRDPDITIRWSAAKGIGRVMGRMKESLGDEVIGCVLELLGPRENDSAWHGGCLALAELSKRGLLLPPRLPAVIPLVKKALIYDEPRGYTSVGTHIRDAACYVAWTFARAYDSHIFQPFVNDMANALIIAACFDREINIRRASSAAFQEHIGRQGTFPHGIEILTTADYFSVGVRNNSYLNISVYVAQFEEYTTSLIDHLIEHKIDHWDVAVRELSAKALHNLTPQAPLYMVEIVLPSLLQKTNSIDVNCRHGSIMAIGEIVHAISLLENNLSLGEDIISAIRDRLKSLKEKNYLKGVSSDLMKIAFCHFIYKVSLAKLPVHDHEVVDEWQTLIDECLCHEVGNMRIKAAQALHALGTEYYQCDAERALVIVRAYAGKLNANDEIIRLGHALALGSLPKTMLVGSVDLVVNSLINCATLTFTTEKWAESRRTAIKALTDICNTVGIDDPDEKNSCLSHVQNIMECMIEGLRDYTKDDRGDTGAWVREASMSGLQTLMQLTAKHAPFLLTEQLVASVISSIVQQAVERIDRVRALAGKVFSALLHNTPVIPHIPQREELLEIFPLEACKSEINWISQHETFPKFTQMISMHQYTYKLMEGFIISIGGLTESLVKASSGCFFSYLDSQPVDELHRLCEIISNIYEANIKVDRIVLPMLNFLELLFSSGKLSRVLECPESKFPNMVFSYTKTALVRSTDKFKLLGSVDVYCQLIQVKSEVSRNALKRIMILLAHRFAYLRKATANKFYEALMLYSDELDIPGDSLDAALNILSETEWNTLKLEQVVPIRDRLSVLFNIPPPAQVKRVEVES